jgi:hypothetical protein
MTSWTEENPDKPLTCSNVPKYADVIKNGIGYYLHNPAKADKKQVFIE